MAEKVARLDKRQWGILKAALDGEIADLQLQLQQAQEELTKYKEFYDDALIERDAAIERAEAAETELDRVQDKLEAADEEWATALRDVAEQRALAEARGKALEFASHHLEHFAGQLADCKVGPDRCTACLVQWAIDLTPAEAQEEK